MPVAVAVRVHDRTCALLRRSRASVGAVRRHRLVGEAAALVSPRAPELPLAATIPVVLAALLILE